MSQNLSTFSMTLMLDSDEAIAEYLSQVFAEGDHEEFLRAIKYVNEAYLILLTEKLVAQKR